MQVRGWRLEIGDWRLRVKGYAREQRDINLILICRFVN